jgi:hypothetical protein
MDEEGQQELELGYEMDEEEKAINEERIYLANLRVQRNQNGESGKINTINEQIQTEEDEEDQDPKTFFTGLP